MQTITKFFGELIQRLTSRKFLLTLSGAALLAANSQWDQLVILLATYTGFEGAADVYSRVKDTKTDIAKINQQTSLMEAGIAPAGETLNRNIIVPGDDSSTQ